MNHPMAGTETGDASYRGVHEFQFRAATGDRPRFVRNQVIEHLSDYFARGGRSSHWAANRKAVGGSH